MLYRQKRTREKIEEDLQKDRERKRALSKKGDNGDIKKHFDEREENSLHQPILQPTLTEGRINVEDTEDNTRRGGSDDITVNVSLEEDIKGKVEPEGITINEQRVDIIVSTEPTS